MKKFFKAESIISLDMADVLNKHYTLSRNENYEQFLYELGVSKIVAARAVTLKPTVTLSRQNHEYLLTTSYPGFKTQAVKFRIGEKVSKRWLEGVPSVSIFKLRDSRLMESQRIGEKKVHIVREFGRSFLKVTMRVRKVKCLKIYSSSESKHSIQTETSRRESLIRSDTITEDDVDVEMENSVQASAQDYESFVCY